MVLDLLTGPPILCLPGKTGTNGVDFPLGERLSPEREVRVTELKAASQTPAQKEEM